MQPRSHNQSKRLEMDKNTPPEVMCQSIFMNLLLSGLRDVSATTYLKEWHETARCDAFTSDVDLRSIREANERFVEEQEEGTMARVLTGNATREDEQRAMACAYHYKFYHDAQLRRALTRSNWFAYHVYYRPVETLALVSSIGIGVKWAMRPLASMRQAGEKLFGPAKSKDAPR